MDHTANSNSTAPMETLDADWQIFFVTLYSVTAVIAFLFNLLTIVVLVKGRRCPRDLRSFLLNLAIVDLCMAMTTIPTTYTNYMFGRWLFWPILCPLLNVAQLSTITVSIYILVAIAIDRYWAILHPLEHARSCFKRHRTAILLVIWTFGLSIGCTQLVVTKTDTFLHGGVQYNSCGERWEPETIEGQLYTGFIFCITFALPMAVLCIVNTAMGWRIWRYKGPPGLQGGCGGNNNTKLKCNNNNFEEQQLPNNVGGLRPMKLSAQLSSHSSDISDGEVYNPTGSHLTSLRRNKVLRMLVTVIAVFALSWAPIQIFTILIYFAPNFLEVHSPTKYYTFVFSYFCCHYLSCAHAFLNSIIYSFMSENFRYDIADLCHRFWKWHFLNLQQQSKQQRQFSSAQQHQHQMRIQSQQSQLNNNNSNATTRFSSTSPAAAAATYSISPKLNVIRLASEEEISTCV